MITIAAATRGARAVPTLVRVLAGRGVPGGGRAWRVREAQQRRTRLPGVAGLLRLRKQLARRAAGLVLLALGAQLTSSMVLRGFPLWLATAHSAGAACLLMATVALNRVLRPTA